MDNKRLLEILNHPTTTVPIAGEAVSGLSRNGSYEAASRGDIPTIRIGSKLSVPTAWIRQKLMISEDGKAA